jgi:hypothetical protein
MKRLPLAILVCLATTATLVNAASRVATPQTLFFDAVFTQAGTAGPSANQVGHLQIASGMLRDANGRSVGRFAFTCRWTKTLPNNDALEHCTGWAQTREGRLYAAGPSRQSDPTHQWLISRGSGAYQGARGTAVVRDLGTTEDLLTATITTKPGTTLRTGVLALPAANNRFRAHADALCTATAKQLAALPRFPFTNFDPLHPDPKLLPKVGRFFTGPGDPRPLLRGLNTHLRALGQPPADRNAWTHVLAAQIAGLAVRTAQDNAALTANASAFVKSLGDVNRAYRQTAITATVFGVSDCIQ